MISELSADRLALFLDVDGTLIDIAPSPDEVVVTGTLIETLTALNRRLSGALALVSGRTIADIDRLFSPLRLRASGVHGAEVRFAPDTASKPTAIELPVDAIRTLRAIADRFAGTLVEDKRFSVAIHYRAAPHAGPALLGQLETFISSPAGEGFRILPGHMVFEVKRATFDKGLAISRLLDHTPFLDRVPVFLGDDVTDRPGFETVLAKGGYAFSVGQAFPGLSGSFPSPESVRQWLAGLALAETSNA